MAAEFLEKDRASTLAEATAEATAAALSSEDYTPGDDDLDTTGEEWKNPA